MKLLTIAATATLLTTVYFVQDSQKIEKAQIKKKVKKDFLTLEQKDFVKEMAQEVNKEMMNKEQITLKKLWSVSKNKNLYRNNEKARKAVKAELELLKVESKNKSIKAEVNKYISAIDAKADIEEIKLANDTQVHGISENEIRLKPEDFEAFQDKISFTRAAMAYFTNQNDTYTCQNITTTNPSTTGDALTGSDIFTQRTSEVVELANKLATPQKAFQFVKNFVRFMPLYGAGQSASQVMTSKKGTSLDKASLLVALLRSQGTPAVYRTGEILIDEDKLMRLYETEDNEELAIAHVSLLSKYLSSPGINPYDRLVYYKEGKRRWVMPHTWVLAYIDGQWIELDPTNTDKELSGPLNIASSDRAGESNIVDWLSSVQRGSIVDRLTRENRNSPLPRVGEEHINGRSENDFEMGSVGYSQCIENQSAFIPQNYQFRVGITAHTMNINLPLPNFISGTVSLTHTTGLLGESVGSSGLLQLKSEGDILSQISINKGQLVNVTREITYPSRYSDLVNLRPSQRITGGVSVFDISPYGGVQKELENQIAHLRDLKASGATSQQRMVALLKLAGIMYRVRHEELSHDLQHIRGFRAITLHNSEVLTSSGTLVTRDDRVLGEIPVLTTIDIRGSSNTYFIDRTFNDTDFLDIWRERAVLGSELEHLVWEELYGISAASSIRVIQEKAQENLSNVIMGQVAKPSNINTITSQLASNLNSLPQGIINNIVVFGESEIYVPRDRLILSSGWEGGAYLMIGKNGGFAAIIYTFVSARTTSNGGVGTGTTDDAGEASEDVLTEAPRQGTSCPPGNPVVVATGAMYHVFNDFEVAGRTPNTSLKFVRTYLTKSKGNLGDLGGKWTHNYEERLEFPFSNKVIYFDDLGGGASFTKNGASFVSPKGNFSTLTEFTDRYELTEKGGVVKVFSKGDTLIPDGRLLKIRDPHGEEVTLNYTAGILTSVSAPLAGTISFVRNGDGKIEQVVRERDSLTNIYQYDLSGNLISHIDVDSNIEQYEYVDDMPGTQAQGLLEKVIDKKGVTAIEFSYYENGQVFEDKTPLGGKLTYQYSPFFDRNFTRMTGTEGQVTEFLMDEEFRQIETVFANRSRRQVEWTNDNLVASITDELGAKTEFTYDARGNRTGVKRPEYSSYSTITYDQTYDIPTQINPLVGSPTTITLDPNDGDITNILRIDSQGNLNLDFTHDQFGNILQTNNGLASYTNVTNNDGELTSLFDSRNSEGRQYDSHHRLWKRTFSNGREITLGYDDLNRVTSVTDTNGPDITQIFDELGQLTSRTVSGNGESQTTTYEWDDRNRLVAIVDPVGRRTEIEYELYSVGCGTIDKPTLIRDPAGRVTQMIYNNMARLIAVVDPLGNKTKFFYNLRGDRIGVQDPAGNLTRFEYDGNRRLVKRIRPVTRTGERNKSVLAEQVTRFFYNEADQLVREETDLLALTNGTNKGKLATELTYNLIDRVSRKVIKEEFMGDVTIKDDSNFTYSRQLDVTRLATANNQTVNLTFDYENTPPFAITNYTVQAVDTNNPLGLIQGSFTVVPDTTGEIGSISKDGSQLYSKSYDLAGRLTGITSNYASQSYTASIIRDAFGRKDTVSHSTGIQSSYTYDLLNRITNLTHVGAGENFSQSINYNATTGNIEQIVREIGTFNYTHDDLDQLTGVNFSGTPNLGPLVTNRTMSYDKAGNRNDDSYFGETSNSRNTILSNEQWTYYTDRDGLGDIIQKSNSTEAHLFEYRGDKRLKKYTHIQNGVETNNTVYYFDALGRRVAREVMTPISTFTNAFAYEADLNKILLSIDGDGIGRLNIDGQGIDEHIAQIDSNGVVTAYITNHLGTVLNSEVTSIAKATGAFGEILQSLPTLTSSTNPVIYVLAGRQYDVESDTIFNRERQLFQNEGRFPSLDPAGFIAGDMNITRYVGNAPTKYSDPLGLVITYKNGVDPLGLDLLNQLILYRVDSELNPRKEYVTKEVEITVTETSRDPEVQQEYFEVGRSSAAGIIPYSNIGYHVSGGAIDFRASGVSENELADAAKRAGARTTIPYYEEGTGRIHASARSRSGEYHPRRFCQQ